MSRYSREAVEVAIRVCDPLFYGTIGVTLCDLLGQHDAFVVLFSGAIATCICAALRKNKETK